MCFLERVESIERLQNREVGQSLWIGVGEKDRKITGQNSIYWGC